MIIWLRHAEIDPAAWDQAVAGCANASWYGQYSTLEAVAPGWDALVDEKSGARMPLPWRRKFGINYLFQPFLIQHLGPYSPMPEPGETLRFLQAVPAHFRYADICISGDFQHTLPQVRTEKRTNHVLRLDGSAEDLNAGYSENHRRSLRKAERLGVQVETGVGSDEVTAFLESSDQFKRWRVDAAGRLAMRRVLRETGASGMGFGLMVRNAGKPVAGGWFVRHNNRIIFLKGLGTAEGRDLRAMHALIHHVVAEHAGKNLVLDFAGGNDPQLARFYAGFGAETVVYLRALMNRLPPLVRRLKP